MPVLTCSYRAVSVCVCERMSSSLAGSVSSLVLFSCFLVFCALLCLSSCLKVSAVCIYGPTGPGFQILVKFLEKFLKKKLLDLAVVGT